MLRLPLAVIILLCAITVSFGQSKKKKKGKAQTTQQQSSSLAPYYPEKDYAPKQEKKKKKGGLKAAHTAEEKYYDRMSEVAKANRKAEKEMLKPQYSDPTYFGHKRKPKKRPPHKMKFCKECEIRH